MALSMQTVVESINYAQTGVMTVVYAEQIKNGDELVAVTRTNKKFYPDSDLTGEDAQIQAMGEMMYTDLVKARWATEKEAYRGA